MLGGVVLEACVNHFIHRDYTVMGGEVHLDIYDDRIALTSPGGMYSGQNVQDFAIEEISSVRRNPVLADVMAQLDYMEKRGSGLKRICNETRALESYKEERIGLKGSDNFRNKYLYPAIESGYMALLYPENKNE